MATTTIANLITLDGAFLDWPAGDMIMTAANTVAGYQVYGAFLDDATLGNTYVLGIDATASTDPVIAAGTVIYLNTDQNNTTGVSPFGNVGAEYEVQFALDSGNVLQAYLYSVTSAGVTTPLNGGAPLDSGFSSNGESVELAIPQSLLTPNGGAAPTSINFAALINGSEGLPGDFANDPEYIITDPAAVPPPTTIANTITLDGTFTDWPAGDMVMTPGNAVTGYQVYGAFLTDATLGNTYVIGIDATAATDPVIGAGTIIYLNTDQNTATGYSPFGNIGAEYEVQFSYGANSELQPYLYSVTSANVTTLLNDGAPLNFGFSSNGESVEVAIPQSLLTPTSGAAPTSINFAALINNTEGLPSDFISDPEYTITDPATLVPVNSAIKKVGIVYSATTAALYFGLNGPQAITAYDDLFMDAQHQAEAAGVSYDILTEADLTNVAKLSQYSALIFPDFQDVQSTQVSAIASALSQVVYDYHVPIITGGEFMTNDQNGNPLPGDPYANMKNLLNVTQSGFGTATYSVTPDPTALANETPVLDGYTSGELIGGASGDFAGTTAGYYTDTGYLTFSGYTQPATTVADINIQGGATQPGVVQTTTGGTNTVFATTGLEGDSNLLQHAIQNAVFGTPPSLSLDITRFAGVLDSRTDMDQSQFPTDVDPVLYDDAPAGTPGIYDELIPILQQLQQQYDFVGSYYINVGDDANPANDNTTNWTISLPYYDDLIEMGDEIGDHSYTHLIDPPTTTVPETTTTVTPAGSTQVTVSTLPSYNGATVGMTVTDSNNDFGPNTVVTAVSGDATSGYTLTLLYAPGGYGTTNLGALNDIPAGSTLTFGIPAENTNFLGTGTGPFTYDYEFGQSKAIEGANIGITIDGAAVPGATEVASTSDQIEQYFQTAGLPAGNTGYVNGGWTGVGSGAPNAFGYIDPSDTGSVYIAPNITFDFTDVQYENKTPAQTLADWESLFNQVSANSESPIIVWPWHDYGITDWPTDGVGTTPPGYTSGLYSGFIAYAYNAGYEFVTTEDLASRIAAEQAATLTETTSGNVITATVTPAASEPDLGAMALNVVNGAAGQVIENAGSWYAYDSNSVFVPYGGGAFNVTLGTTQDNVTHVDYLPMRADLQSVTGNGSNLIFSFTGDGTVDAHVKTPGTNAVSIQLSAVGTGAGPVSATLVGDDLSLVFDDGALAISADSPQGVPVLHNVTITESPTAAPGASIVFDGPTVAITTPAGQTTTASQTISGTATESVASETVGTTVTLYDNGSTTALGTATVQAGGAWSTTVTLSQGANSIVAKDTDLANMTGASSAVIYTFGTPPTIAGTHATPTTSDAAVSPFTGVTIGDLNAGATDTLTITLSNSGTTGTLTGTGLSGGTNGVYTLLSGVAGTVTSELDALTFTPAKGPPNTVTTTTFALSDLSTADATPVTDSATAVTDTDAAVAPTIAGTHATPTTSNDWVNPFTGVTIGDLNAGATVTDTLTIMLSNSGTTGALSGTGLSGGTNGVYTLSGVAGTVTSELDLLTFTPAMEAPNTVTTTTFTLSDVSTAYATSATDSNTTVIDTDAAIAPTIAGTHATQTTFDAAVNPFTGVTIGDLNAGATDALTITLSNSGTTGALSGTGLSGRTNGVYTLSGVAGTVTSELNSLKFTPAKGAANTVTTTTFALSDLSTVYATPATDSATTVTDTDAAIAPAIAGTHATQTTFDAAVHPFTGVTIGDANAGATDALRITLSNSGTTGKLSGTGLSGGTSGVYMLSGAAGTVTSELDLLTFTPVKGAANSVTTTTFALSDLSNAYATAATDSATTVTDTDAVVAPTIVGTHATSTTMEGAVDPFTGVTITDANSGATDTLTITLSSGTSGKLSGTGLGVGANGVYTLKGAAATVTSELDSLIFTPAKGAAGSVTTMTFTLSDQSTAYGPAVTNRATTVTDTDGAAAPTIVGTHATSTTSDAAVNPFTNVTIGDVNPGATDTLTIALSNGLTTGALSGKGLTGGTNGVYTLSGTAATVTSALDLLSFKPATGAAGSVTTTTFTLSDKSTAYTTAASDSGTTVTDTDAAAPGQLAITSASYSTAWILGGTALAGATVTIYNGATSLGTVVATSGSWTFTTKLNNTAIRDFTVTASNSSVPSAAYFEGTTGADTFDFASEPALSAAALINGGGGTDTLQMTSATTLADTDFAHIQAIEILGLTGASSVTLGPNASAGGIGTVVVGSGATSVTDNNSGTLAVNATALGAGNLLTLSGSTADTVTGLTGNLSATGDNGALTVTATGTTAQTVATGSGNMSIADSAAGSVTVDATGLGTNTLTLTGSAAKTVNNLTGNVVVTGAATITVNATGSASVTTGNGTTTITDKSGAMTVNDANAKGSGHTLTLSGSAAATVTSLAQNLAASGVAGALNVTTSTNALSIATGSGANTINAGAMTDALTLTGTSAATLTALGGNLTATGDSGALTVTTTGGTQTVTTGSNSISIADTSTGVLTVNATALAVGSTLTLTGAGAANVTGLKGSLIATGDSGALTVTDTGTAQTVATGSGATSIADSATGGSVTVDATALGTNTLTLTGSAAKTVNNLAGNLVATGAGAITVTATGAGPQTIQTGSGKDMISITAATGGDTIQGGGGGDSINVSGHTAADSFIYAATSDSLNTTAGHDTIAGFAASGSIYDVLDFSKLNPGLSIKGQVSSGSTVAADSIAWLYSMGNAMLYVNDTASALATGNASLMEITLQGVSSGLSTSNFHA